MTPVFSFLRWVSAIPVATLLFVLILLTLLFLVPTVLIFFAFNALIPVRFKIIT